MTQSYSPNGETVSRDDGSEVYPVVYIDGNGKVVDKAYIPVDHEPEVPAQVDTSRSATVDASTDLSTLLSDSPANLPDSVPHPAAETAIEKLKNIRPDTEYAPDEI